MGDQKRKEIMIPKGRQRMIHFQCSCLRRRCTHTQLKHFRLKPFFLFFTHCGALIKARQKFTLKRSTKQKRSSTHTVHATRIIQSFFFNAGEQKVSSESGHERVNRRDRSEAHSGTPKTKWHVAFYWNSSDAEPQHSGPGQLTNTGSRLRTAEEDIGHSFVPIFKAATISIFIRLSQYQIFTIWLSRQTEFTKKIIINDSYRKEKKKKLSHIHILTIHIFNFVYSVSF